MEKNENLRYPEAENQYEDYINSLIEIIIEFTSDEYGELCKDEVIDLAIYLLYEFVVTANQSDFKENVIKHLKSLIGNNEETINHLYILKSQITTLCEDFEDFNDRSW